MNSAMMKRIQKMVNLTMILKEKIIYKLFIQVELV